MKIASSSWTSRKALSFIFNSNQKDSCLKHCKTVLTFLSYLLGCQFAGPIKTEEWLFAI
jgi:hypothetical protein